MHNNTHIHNSHANTHLQLTHSQLAHTHNSLSQLFPYVLVPGDVHSSSK